MILIVDDQPENRYVLARILKRHGYDVMQAAAANEAVALLEKSHFDLVVTDVQMPGQNGLVLTVRVRVKWPETPILLMSGQPSAEIEKIVAQGWAEFLPKPIEPSILIPTIRRLLDLGAGKITLNLRRKIGMQTWHACTTCNDWPSSDYEEMPTYLSDKLELCNECRLSLSQGNCL